MKARFAGLAILAAVALGATGCSGSNTEEAPEPPTVNENINTVDGITLIKKIGSISLEPGIYKLCDGDNLVYFTYGASGNERNAYIYTVSSITPIVNSSECMTP